MERVYDGVKDHQKDPYAKSKAQLVMYILIRLFAAASLIFFSVYAVGHQNTPKNMLNSQDSIVSLGISTLHIDPSIKPADDFYRYANGQWLDNTKIPKRA